MNLDEKKISEKNVYKGKIIDLVIDKVELPNGFLSTREVVKHPGGVCICALTKENELLFVRQYRCPFSKVILELPAGKLELGSDPLENGKRELKEETGTVGKDYVSLGKLYVSPGYSSEIIYMYFCKVESYGSVNPDEDEFLEVERIPLDKAVKMVLENEIADSKTQVAVLKTYMLLNEGKI